MANNKNQEPVTVYIPDNFSEGTSVMGFAFKLTWIVQCVPAVALFAVLIFVVGAALSFKAKIILAVVTCAPPVTLSATGINGDSLFGFIAHVVKFRRSRHICFYNPRLKSEAVPFSAESAVSEAAALEKILNLINRKKLGKYTSRKTAQDINKNNLVFADDKVSAEEKK